MAAVEQLDWTRPGRSVAEGYERGWGLMHGALAAELESEALYLEAVERAGIPSLMTRWKRLNLYAILTRYLPRLAGRSVIEFGSYRGGNALFMALVLREVAPEAKVFALDTFEGMPDTDPALDLHTKGNFSDAQLDQLQARIAELGLDNLIPVKGLFETTFPREIAPLGLKFGLAHIDADIYSAVKYAQDAVWPHMTPGGYVAYDDADVPSCIGATQAVEELIMARRVHSEQIWPHFVFRAYAPQQL